MTFMKPKFSENPDYRRYEQLLIRTHELIARGEGDSEEADAVREAMDAPWYRLSEAEQIRLRGLSGDLYMLQDEEVLQTPLLSLDDCIQRLIEAREWNDWGAVLGLLRHRPPAIFNETTALLRAQAYDGLGHPNAALLFLDFAHRAHRSDSGYRAVRMLMAASAGHFEEIIPEADRIVQTGEKDVWLLVAATDVILQRAGTLIGDAKSTAYHRILAALNLTCNSNANGVAPMFLLVCAHLIRAVALWELGQESEALAALDAAVDIDPGDRFLQKIRDDVRKQQTSETGGLSIVQALNHRRDLLRRELQSSPKIAA
jgi:hypothetical protein